MKITNLETRAYLALNAPYWLGRIEKAPDPIYLRDEYEMFDGVFRSLMKPSTCLMGEIYNDTTDYEKCSKCSGLIYDWFASDWDFESSFLSPLDNLIQHQIKCHEKPELKILAEEKFILAV